MKRVDVVTEGWDGYQLLDTGNGRKLEQFGTMIVDRPDPQVLWSKKSEHTWMKAQAHFVWKDENATAQTTERWAIEKDIPQEWSISYRDTTIALSFGQFKHIGIFPEHAAQWEELRNLATQYPGIRVLNLFGYTGIASVVAAKAGAVVTHVDASKQTMATVKENMNASGLSATAMRTIIEDAPKYVRRLIQRGETFDVILLDPPAFGRGPQGELWKIEEKLQSLMSHIPKLLSLNAKMVLLNGYASGYSARTFGELLDTVLPNGTIEYGDVGIKQKDSDRILSTGIYAKWMK